MSTNIQKNAKNMTAKVTRNYIIDRKFVGTRTAEELVADLMRVHAQEI